MKEWLRHTLYNWRFNQLKTAERSNHYNNLVIITAGGMEIFITDEDRKPQRIQISCYFPSYDNYGSRLFKKITVNRNRSISVIAQEIKSRCIKGYEEAFKIVLKKKEEALKKADILAYKKNLLKKFFPKFRKVNHMQDLLHSSNVDVIVCAISKNVKLKIETDIETTFKILALLKEIG